MEALWYGVVAAMLAVYVALDGYDLGAGALHLLVARDDAERREVLGAIGPFWDGNEVWLVAAGGALVLAFPVAYAVGFSGFYLPLFLVLWLLLLRGLGIEFRGHVENPLWAAFWDVVFAVGSSLLAVVLGVALGNVIRGVPIDATGTFYLTFFDGFLPGPRSGVLDAYTVLVGLFTLVALAAHGGNFLAWRARGEVRERSRRSARRLWVVAGALFPVVTWATLTVQPRLLGAAGGRPLVWLGVAVAASAAALLAWALARSRPALAFGASGALLLGLLATAAAASWPLLLRSTLDPRYDVTAWNAAAQGKALRAAVVWASIGLPLACAYFVHVARTFAAPPGDDRHAP
ncbi:MAG TPA: cytochrome d ubiquinol oxidase subunit II [Anaeromyxobacteraceae bacterium]|nr:cytochrome d ubiquinol oxidase subunit II [Anaeromyxobacteraceae bacterium]